MTYERGRQWQRCKDEDNEDKRRQTERERKHSAPPQAKNDVKGERTGYKSGYERREVRKETRAPMAKIEDVGVEDNEGSANPRGTCRTTESCAHSSSRHAWERRPRLKSGSSLGREH
ncbi:hypothetical protein BGY98DRAFT_1036932 [Russula aff. rugulosa BPL654]|nr:hypothetical protein BGY98DRAFT_1039188 [Russula aff. rugulosa BPL654]KAI0265247.1 hypothetical protein BGY98DRAFT_1036932 [Russula aff. rugulosa BPL654]